MQLLYQTHKLVDIFKIIKHFNSNIEYATSMGREDELDEESLNIRKVSNLLLQDIGIQRMEP